MNIKDLAKLAFPELLERALAGDLSPASLWLAVSGATKYAEAVARGDIATLPVQASRAARCKDCPVLSERPMKGRSGDSVAYCGSPFTESTETVWKHCGCLVVVSINGETLPAGKTVVASEKCPNGFW